MKKISFFILLCIFTNCSKYNGDPKSLDYDSVVIEFYGLKGDFYRKGKLELSFTNKEIIEKLNRLKNKSRKAPLFSSLRPVLYQIRLIYSNSRTNDKLLVTINSNDENEIIIVRGRNHYINEKLYIYVSSLIRLDHIKNFPRELNQEAYEKILNL